MISAYAHLQKMIGESARGFQERVARGEQAIVGVNAYRVDEASDARQALERPDPAAMQAHLAAFAAYKAQEAARVTKLKDGKVSADKKKMLDLRLNILSSFKATAKSEL